MYYNDKCFEDYYSDKIRYVRTWFLKHLLPQTLSWQKQILSHYYFFFIAFFTVFLGHRHRTAIVSSLAHNVECKTALWMAVASVCGFLASIDSLNND